MIVKITFRNFTESEKIVVLKGFSKVVCHRI